MSLIHIIENGQSGDKEAVLNIINHFKPKIKKCANQLGYEEAETDLIIALIETITSMDITDIKNDSDGAVVNYICRILEHRKVDLFRKFVKGKKEEFELKVEKLQEETKESIDDKIFVENIFNILPTNQKKILRRKYMEGFSDTEIAEEMDISRQAVNRAKNKAFHRIRNVFCDENFMRKGVI